MADAERKTPLDFKELAREVAYRWCMAGGNRDHLKVPRHCTLTQAATLYWS